MPKTGSGLEANIYTCYLIRKRRFWVKQIKDCQGSIPVAEGKDQGFMSRTEMTSQRTMGEMMYLPPCQLLMLD